MDNPGDIERPIIVRGDGAAPAPLTGNACLDLCLHNRGVRGAGDLDTGLGGLPQPRAMADIGKAADRLADAVQRGERVLILGDYDVDGATATTVMAEALAGFGASQVEWAVPDRVAHGYGLSPAVAAHLEARRPDVLVTVDNGTASIDGARAVASWARPPDLIITDHHLESALGEPEALAIVNPNRPRCGFPTRSLAGCGVAWYVAAAVRQALRERGAFPDGEPDIAALLDLVALATVADMVPMDRVNRTLVEHGIARLRAGRGRPGIKALMAQARIDRDHLTTADISFGIGPRLNAAGRMANMSAGIDALRAPDFRTASRLARALEAMNVERRDELDRLASLDLGDWGAEAGAAAMVAFRAGAHEGVVGLAASRLVERHGRPAVCFAQSGAGRLKGSARSVEGVHVKHVLDGLHSARPDWFHGFGGHAMAAGLSIREDALEPFREAFAEAVAATAAPGALDGARYVDRIDPPAEWHGLETALALEAGAHWGAGFEPPAFAGRLRVAERTPLRGGHLRLLLACPSAPERRFEGVLFSRHGDGPPRAAAQGPAIDCRYALEVRRRHGRAEFQVRILDVLDGPALAARPAAGAAP